MNPFIFLCCLALSFSAYSQTNPIEVTNSIGDPISISNIKVFDQVGNLLDIEDCLMNGNLLPDLNCVAQNNPDAGQIKLVLTKNDALLNGVSTLDLVLIHKAAMEQIELPFMDLIAADLNQSNSVSTIDLYHMRRMILGSEMPIKGSNWLFFKDSIEDETELSNISKHELVFDIIDFPLDELEVKAIKLGDVNNSAW